MFHVEVVLATLLSLALTLNQVPVTYQSSSLIRSGTPHRIIKEFCL
jgi:hypothetical protein